MKRFLWQNEIKLNITVLRLLALLPADGEFKKSNPYTYLTILFVSYSTIYVSLQAMHLRVTYSSFEKATDTIFFCIPQYLAVVKMYIFVTKAKMLKRLLQNISKDSFQPKSAKQISLIRPDIQLWKIIHRGLMVACAIAIVLICSLPILTGSVKKFELPFEAWYPYDIQTPISYALTFISQLFGAYVLSFGTCNVDMLMSALMVCIGAQCDIICDNLRNRLKSKNFGSILEECVVHHRTILRFAEECNEFFNMIILAQFFGSITTLALGLFRLVVVEAFTFEFYFYSCMITIFTLESFSFCWFGDKIQTKSEKIIYALFESFWITQSLADKKSMIIFAERAQIPIKFATYKLFYLTLGTFVKILRSGMSYYTVLRQFSDRR